MTTAKSLKKLRSASNAFLEDGGSLLHGVDSLLRDIQQTLSDLQRREEILVEREIALEAREVCLDDTLNTLASRVASLDVSAVETPEPKQNLLAESSPEPVATVSMPEEKLVKELTEIQSTVSEIVSAASQTQRLSNHRKKRRR